jgi:import inner membrane translocase subunit TIM9
MKDAAEMYVFLTKLCFNDCVNDFTSTTMGKQENECVNNCVDKFMNFSKRAGFKFQELSAQLGAPTMQ